MNSHSVFKVRLIESGLLALAASDIRPPALSLTESGNPAISPEVGETTAQFCQLAAEEFAAIGKTVEAVTMFDQAGQHDPALADRNAHRLAVLHDEADNTQSAGQVSASKCHSHTHPRLNQRVLRY